MYNVSYVLFCLVFSVSPEIKSLWLAGLNAINQSINHYYHHHDYYYTVCDVVFSVVQSQLPETGVPVTRQRVDQMKDMFADYVKNRTLQNWKFWIVSFLLGQVLPSQASRRHGARCRRCFDLQSETEWGLESVESTNTGR